MITQLLASLCALIGGQATKSKHCYFHKPQCQSFKPYVQKYTYEQNT